MAHEIYSSISLQSFNLSMWQVCQYIFGLISSIDITLLHSTLFHPCNISINFTLNFCKNVISFLIWKLDLDPLYPQQCDTSWHSSTIKHEKLRSDLDINALLRYVLWIMTNLSWFILFHDHHHRHCFNVLIYCEPRKYD